jgi:Spy/CpxP family protein refolding chaperone
MDKLRQQRRQEFASILTPEQLQKLDTLRANRPPPGAAPAEEETAPASKSAGVQQESWGSIKYQSR